MPARRRARATQILAANEVRWARHRYFTPDMQEKLTRRQIADELDVTVWTVARLLRYETYRGIT
jgi:hypothetical protein